MFLSILTNFPQFPLQSPLGWPEDQLGFPLGTECLCIWLVFQLCMRHNILIILVQVGALQDVRSELTKLRGVLFYKVLEDLHAHLYNRGEYR